MHHKAEVDPASSASLPLAAYVDIGKLCSEFYTLQVIHHPIRIFIEYKAVQD